MSENESNDVQDPAEPKKVDVAVETTAQPAAEQAADVDETAQQTRVETSVVQSPSE